MEPRSLGFTVPVTVHIPDTIYKRLAAAGRHHGATVADLAAECIRRALITSGALQRAQGGATRKPGDLSPTGRRIRSDVGKPRHRWTENDDDEVRRMHTLGYSDGQIGAELNWSGAQISVKRTALGLAPNFHGRRKATN